MSSGMLLSKLYRVFQDFKKYEFFMKKKIIFRDTLVICFGNCLTSFTAGFAIFSVLGFMAKELGLKIEDVAVDGGGLAFVAYPDLVTRLPGAPFCRPRQPSRRALRCDA